MLSLSSVSDSANIPGIRSGKTPKSTKTPLLDNSDATFIPIPAEYFTSCQPLDLDQIPDTSVLEIYCYDIGRKAAYHLKYLET